jgi:hypothetical protein
VRELHIPSGVESSDDAGEFVRFWIADGSDLVALHVGAMGENEPDQWGMILADISIHVVRALQQMGSHASDEELRAQIEKGYLQRLKAKNIAHSGSVLGTRQ